jgi:single-strand DNA-binding protein
MFNKVTLVGNLGKDPELKMLSGDNAVCKLRIATSRTWFDKKKEEKVEETEWHDIEVWGKAAEACGKYLTKGRQVLVEGRIKTDTWEDKETKEKKYRVKIVADDVKFLGGKGDKEQASAPDDVKPPADPDDDLPF